MNRQSRRHPSSSLLPAFYPSAKSVISEDEKRKNSSVNAKTVRRRKAERGL